MGRYLRHCTLVIIELLKQ